MAQKIIVIGSGFSSLSAACYLAKAGFKVDILEKNKTLGGRARQLKHKGFCFDMGPSFYWMPDVFESFFQDFAYTVSDYYTLNKLNPGYKVFFGENEFLSIPDSLSDIISLFNSIEKGSGKQLKCFIKQAESNYNLAIKDLVYQPGEKITEIIKIQTIKKLPLFFNSIKKQVSKNFTHPWLKMLLEFPVLFLGATPSNTPAFYNFMNYADFGLGTWYPKGGMYKVVESMQKLALELGVKFYFNSEVKSIKIEKQNIKGVSTENKVFTCDILLSGADYAHTETILPKKHRQYSEKYWSKQIFAPSAFMYYVGFDKKLKNIEHHTLFFDADFDKHAQGIYKTKELPKKPLFYASFPTKSDNSIAPLGKEAGVFLIPCAPGNNDSENIRNNYFDMIINRLETMTKQDLKKHILFFKSYGVMDFKNDYNAYNGNAYGLANTLLQTHVLRPKMKSKKVNNLYFTGQLTVPGPGVPPSIISGKIVSELIQKYHK